MTADSTLFAVYVLGIEVAMGCLVLLVAPRITRRMVVPQVMAIFEDDILPRLQEQVFNVAEQRIQAAQERLQGEANAMQQAAMEGARAEIEARKDELRELVAQLGQQMTTAALTQADQRIDQARKELETQLAAQLQPNGHDPETRTPAQQLADRSVESRDEFSMEEAAFEAAAAAVNPTVGPLLLQTAKAFLPRRVWVKTVRQGPSALPQLYERFKGALPAALSGQQAQGGRSSWS